MWCLLMYFFLLWFTFKGSGSDPVASLTPREPIPRSQWHVLIWSRCAIDTKGLDPAVAMTPLNPFKKISKSAPAVSVIDTAESELFKRLSPFSRRIRSHMRNGCLIDSSPYNTPPYTSSPYSSTPYNSQSPPLHLVTLQLATVTFRRRYISSPLHFFTITLR
jgi:hypothetical protein